MAAIGDYIIGSLIGPKSDVEYAKGFVGYNGWLIFLMCAEI